MAAGRRAGIVLAMCLLILLDGQHLRNRGTSTSESEMVGDHLQMVVPGPRMFPTSWHVPMFPCSQQVGMFPKS